MGCEPTSSPECKPPKGLRTPLALSLGPISRWPICHFSALKSAEARTSTDRSRGDRFSAPRARIQFHPLPGCKPQTLQTSVCTLTLSKRRAVASRMGLWPGRTRFAWACMHARAITIGGDHHHRHNHHRRPSDVTVVMVVMVAPYCLHRRKCRHAPAIRLSHAVGLLHPRRDIPLAMQHTPDIDVVWTLNIEDEVRIVRQRPGAQTGQVEFVGVAG